MRRGGYESGDRRVEELSPPARRADAVLTCTTCGDSITDVWFYASMTGEKSHLTCFPANAPSDRCEESADGMRCELEAGHTGPHVIDPSALRKGDTA